jgi:endo-1,4-beta-D-glucanase Y
MRSWFALGAVGFLFAVVSCGSSELPPEKDGTGGSSQQGKGGTSGAAAKSGAGGSGGSSGTLSSPMCSNGQVSCPVPPMANMGVSTVCTDTRTDGNNCGVCLKKCASPQVCSNSTCTCAAPLLACGDKCANVDSDPMNCGACGTICSGATPYCSQKLCVATCPGTEMACGMACTNTATDPLNCGFCTNACAGGQACSNSACGCPSGQATCAGVCTDTMVTAAHCGQCGHACSPGQSCTSGVCTGGGVGGSGGMGGSAGSGAMAGIGGMSAGAGGTAGTGTTGGAERANCPIKPGLIADFEEGATSMMPVIQKIEDRTGEWEMFNDGKSTSETSTVESSGGTAACDKYALHVKGSGYSDWGAGFGFSLVGTPKMPTVYNATMKGFTGIRFKAKMGSAADAKAPVRLNVSTPWTESSENPGGTCMPTTASTNKAAIDCYQHAGKFLYPGSGANQLTTTFQPYTFCFDRDLYPLSLPSNLTTEQRANIGTNILKIQFQFGLGKDYSGSYPAEGKYPEFTKGLAFDFWIDDVEFITGACPTMVTSPSNGSPAKAFPQNAASTKYGSCDIATNAVAMNGAITEAYKTWQSHFVSGSTVVAPEQSNVVTSESMGYGMLIAAAMGDKALFDKFWGYVKGQLSGGLMTWKAGQSGSASDGDLDIAYALYLAGVQWPSGEYAGAATSMGTAISADLVSNIIRGGSGFTSSNFNPSYFIPVAMRKFSNLSGAVSANMGFVNTNINAGAAKVPTDWANPSNGQPSGPGSAQVTSQIVDGDNGAMGYDAARVPWRLGQDVCLGGTDGSASVTAMVSYFAAKYDSGGRIDLMKAGWYKKSDGPHPEAKDTQGSYIGPMGVAGMAAKNNAMRDSAFRAMLDIMESGDFNHTYFPSTIGFITALIMSGNFPAP